MTAVRSRGPKDTGSPSLPATPQPMRKPHHLRSGGVGGKGGWCLVFAMLAVAPVYLYSTIFSSQQQPLLSLGAPWTNYYPWRPVNESEEPDSVTPQKRYIMYVISLQNVTGASHRNQGRLDDFRQHWNESCGIGDDSAIEFRHCPGELDKRRGFGLTRAFVKCFDLALRESPSNSEGAFAFFEDDARLLNSTSPQFCNAGYRQSLWSSIPNDAFLVFLGGHRWQFADKKATEMFRESLYSWGTFGFVLPGETELRSLQWGFQQHLEHPYHANWWNGPFLSPDTYIYPYAAAQTQITVSAKTSFSEQWKIAPTQVTVRNETTSDSRSKIYKTNPLIVYHKAGFSNTWNREERAIDGTDLRQWHNEEPLRPVSLDEISH